MVMAHCGGSPEGAVRYVCGAMASAPEDPGTYGVLADIWRDHRADLAGPLYSGNSLHILLARAYISFLEGDMDDAVLAIAAVTGAQPTVAWTKAPWFSDPGFLGAVSADMLAEAVLRILDYGRDLDTDAIRESLIPWPRAIDEVCAREPKAEAMAKMAIFLRACGHTDASFALCDQADRVERILYTEVVRGGTWRFLGDPRQAAAAFQRALAMDPANWSLYLDSADSRAEQGDFGEAVRLVEQGLEYEPTEISLRAAAAAYRTRHCGAPDELRDLIALAPRLPNETYRRSLIDTACSRPGLPADLVAQAQRLLGR